MKFIPKYQAGSIFTPYLHQASVFPIQAKAEAVSGEGGLLSKEMVKELMKSGLTSDVDSLINSIQKIEAASANPYNNISTQRATLEIIKSISKVKRNHEMWKDALSIAKSTNKSLNDVAISSQGTIFVKDSKGYLKEMSLLDYSKNKKSIRALTVNELLLERDNNPTMAFNNDLLDPIKNSIGLDKAVGELDKVIKSIKPIITSITTAHNKEDVLKFKRQLEQQLQSGELSQEQVTAIVKSAGDIQTMLNTPGEAFRHTKKTKALEGEDFNIALNTLLTSLQPATRSRFLFQVVEEDIKDSSGNYSLGLYIGGRLKSQLEEQRITSTLPINVPGGGTRDFAITNFVNLHTGQIRSANTEFTLNDAAESNSPGLGFMFNGVVAASHPLVDSKDQQIGMSRIDTLLHTHNYGQLLDTTKMYAGGLKITQPEQFIYSGGTALNVFLPTKNNGEVDYDSIERFKEVYNTFEANKSNLTPAQVRGMFSAENFDVSIEGEGKDMKISATSPGAKNFLVMYAYTTEKAVDLSRKQNKDAKEMIRRYYRPVDDARASALEPRLEMLWKDFYGSGKKSKVADYHPGKPFLWGNNLLKTMVIIPYTPTAAYNAQALVGGAARQEIASVQTINTNINSRRVTPVTTSQL